MNVGCTFEPPRLGTADDLAIGPVDVLSVDGDAADACLRRAGARNRQERVLRATAVVPGAPDVLGFEAAAVQAGPVDVLAVCRDRHGCEVRTSFGFACGLHSGASIDRGTTVLDAAGRLFRWEEPVNRRQFRRLLPTVASGADSFLFSRQPLTQATALGDEVGGGENRPWPSRTSTGYGRRAQSMTWPGVGVMRSGRMPVPSAFMRYRLKCGPSFSTVHCGKAMRRPSVDHEPMPVLRLPPRRSVFRCRPVPSAVTTYTFDDTPFGCASG